MGSVGSAMQTARLREARVVDTRHADTERCTSKAPQSENAPGKLCSTAQLVPIGKVDLWAPRVILCSTTDCAQQPGWVSHSRANGGCWPS